MNEERYLYGAAVQGIQGFIFQTNELKDIVGASELVDKICTSMFEEYIQTGVPIVRAAGNIKVLFRSLEECQHAVTHFPRRVMERAPGITISQAVVKCSKDIREEGVFGEYIDELEKRLRINRNMPTKSVTLGAMGMHRSRTTGKPAVQIMNKEYIDLPTLRKRQALGNHTGYRQDISKLCEKAFGEGYGKDKITTNITELTGKNDWIAIIHADGNGFGQIVREIGKHDELFPKFSQCIDDCTQEACQEAFAALRIKEEVIPFRPIVLSGDDMTMICRAEFAMAFVNYFLEKFENKTKTKMGALAKNTYKNPLNEKQKVLLRVGLTACAGISYIKSSYPFYYGYGLAESLCGVAKKDTKSRFCNEAIVPSCVMFHKVQDSFVQEYSKIVQRELTVLNSDGKQVSFSYGPYYLSESSPKNIAYLERLTNAILVKNEIKTRIRQWLTLMYKDQEEAKQLEERVQTLDEDKAPWDVFKEAIKLDEDHKCPAYDLLVHLTVKNQETKTK